MEIRTFFIKNTPADNELERLLKPPLQKIVFRFQMAPNGSLSLFAHGAKQNGKAFSPGTELDVPTSPNAMKIDENIFFGNIEIGSNADITELRGLINVPGHDYITLRPDKIDNGQIVFELSTPHALTILQAKPNPSPPYDAY
jgi:hypothetical protein